MSDKKYDVGILGVWSGCNYGSIATYYALNKIVSGMGYSVLMIDKPRISDKRDVELEMTHSRRFAHEHYNISKSYRLQDIHALNDQCDIFMMGSDQVWNYGISKNFGKSFYFDFADDSKKKIAYAVSFGHGVDFAPVEERQKISTLMKRFDGISVREADGVKMCRDIYGVEAIQVLDPVFLADRKIFDELADKSTLKVDEPYIATYILDPTPEKVEALQYVSRKLGYRLVNMLDGLPWLYEENSKKLGLESVPNLQVEDWINCFRNSEFVITDSCHGASFALLYDKTFIPITNKRRGFSRFKSLADLFGFRDRLVTDPKTILENENLLKPMDYEKIHGILKSEKKRCGAWLKKMLCTTVETKVPVDKCTGCGMCANICPVGAIAMKPNSEGFMNPTVNYDVCIDCGRCVSKCVALHPQYENTHQPECFAFWAKDEIRKISSSGGVFTVAAEYILDQGGYVAGTVYNEDFSVRHAIISSKKELWKMRGSKYMQSDVGDIYKQVKALLEQDKLVLFTGLPCQIAALYAYLGNKKYEKLYTIDLVCHGITSQKVFDKFHKDVLHGKKITDLQFKAKEPWGWHAGTNVKFEDGTKYSEPLERCPYFIAYLKNIAKNKTCGECQFNKLPRQADLSIGDFWGINKFKPEYNDKKGTSEVLVNNNHGKELLERIRSDTKLLEPVPLEYALNGNPVMKKPYRMHKNRDYFFQNLDKTNFAELTMKCFQNTITTGDATGMQIPETLDSNRHGLYCLAKIVAQNYNGRKIVAWGDGPVFKNVLKENFKLDISFTVFADGRPVNGTTIRAIEDLRGKSADYYVVSLAHPWSVQAEKILTGMGYQPEKDFIFRVHKPIVLENYDLSKGGYADIYGNTISGASGVLKKVVFRGLNSHISLGNKVQTGSELEFDLGTNGKVTVGEGTRFIGNVRFQLLGNNPARATVTIGQRCRFLSGLIKLYGHSQNSAITIGDGSTFESNLELHANSGKKLTIGKDCMFSHNVDVWAGDGHTIFDVVSGKNTNSDYNNLPAYKNEIVLGDHVWVSKGAFILAGTHIGQGSVVGAQSVVKGSFPNNCVVAGNPGRDVKHNVAWSRDMTATDIRVSVPQEYCNKTVLAGETKSDGETRGKKGRSVLILGGSGRMSSKLTALCLNNGDNVTISVRGKHKIGEEISAVNKLVFNRLDENATKENLQGKYYDVVFDCSGYVPQSVDWVLSNLKTKRYIYVSSFETYARYKNGIDRKEEDLPPLTSRYETSVRIGDKAWYARGKYSCECLIASKYADLNYAIVRIPFVMSIYDEDYDDELSSRILEYVSAAISQKPINAFGLDRRYSFVESTDEANFLYSLSHNNFKGVVNFASQGSVSMQEVLQYVEGKTGIAAVIAENAPRFPFTIHPEITMNLEKCLAIGYTPMHLDSWLYKKLDKYISHCKQNVDLDPTGNEQEKQKIVQPSDNIDKQEIQNWFIAGADVTDYAKHLAEKLYKLGYTVAVGGMDIASLNMLPDGILKIKFNAENLNECGKAVEKTEKEIGRIDVLVNNIGQSSATPFSETPIKSFDAVMESNYWPVSNMLKVIIPHMRKNRHGTVISLSSASGRSARSNYGSYVASRFAVDNLTKNMKFECQRFMRAMVVELDESELSNPIGGDNSAAVNCSILAIIQAVQRKELPRNLVLGRNAREKVTQALQILKYETELYKPLSITTDLAKKEKISLHSVIKPRNKAIRNQNWLITGGSGGFGRVLALRLNALGYTVAVTSRDKEKLNDLPAGIFKIESQLADYNECQKVIDTAVAQMGSVDVLVNNATSNCWSSLEECPQEIIQKVFYVNYTLSKNMIVAALPQMQKNKNGTVINITSIAGIQPRARVSTYSAAKAALEGLTRTLRLECSDFIRFMAVELVCMQTGIMVHNPVFDTQIEDYRNLGRYTQEIPNIPNRKDISAQQIINLVNQKELPQSLLIGTESCRIAMNEVGRAQKDLELSREIISSVSENSGGQ